MEKLVVIGNAYAVTSPNGGTVATPEGVTLLTLTAGAQAVFIAQSDRVVISDDAAIVTATNFKPAPGLLAQAGGGTGDPSAIEGDYLLWGQDGTEPRGRLDALTDWTMPFKTATEWNTPLPALQNGSYMFQGSQITTWNTPLPALQNGSHMFQDSQITTWNTPLPALQYGAELFAACRALTTVNIEFPEVTNMNFSFQYCYNLQSFRGAMPKVKSAEWMFNRCKLDLPSVQHIAETIATWTSGTHYITFGMAASLNGNADAAAALAAIRAKGWTVAEQYNS